MAMRVCKIPFAVLAAAERKPKAPAWLMENFEHNIRKLVADNSELLGQSHAVATKGSAEALPRERPCCASAALPCQPFSLVRGNR
eukprot:3042778-Lingulodinium_polyedra.AAC.1